MGPDTDFGASLALDNGVAVVGSPGQRVRSRQVKYKGQGTAHVFTNSDNGWTSQGMITNANDSTGFGTSVAISGNQIIVGAPAANGTGVTYTFRQNENTWEQTGILATPGVEPNDLFGSLIITSSDMAFVSAPGKKQNQGAVFIFDYLSLIHI